MAKKKKDLDLASSSHLNQIQGSTNAIFNVIFVILALACIIPVVFIFMISISSEHSIKMNGYQFIPSAYSLDSYKFLLREGHLGASGVRHAAGGPDPGPGKVQAGKGGL